MATRFGRGRTAVTTLAVAVAVASTWASAQTKADPKRSRLPAAVVKALDANCPGAEIDKLDIENDAGIKFYDFEFKAGRGEMDVTEDGTVLDIATMVELKDVPEPAAAIIRKAAGTNGIRQLEKSEIRSKIEKQDGKGRLVPVSPHEYVYEAELVKGGEVEVTADGKVIKGPKPKEKESPNPK